MLSTGPTVDPALCSQDGLCTRVCPMTRLELGPQGHPQPRADVRCLSCGHCVAVCPKGALAMGEERPQPLPSDWRLDASRVGHLLKGRRSIRLFRAEPLSRETIAAMIGAAQYAPSGHNSQPLSWTVIGDASEVKRIARVTADWMRRSIAAGSPMAAALNMTALVEDWDAGRDTICRAAPHLIVAHAPAALPTGSHAAAIAMTYLDLAAQPLGAGTCWAGFVFIGAGASAEVHDSLGLPGGQRCAGIVMAGRPAVSYRRIPSRNQPQIQWR